MSVSFCLANPECQSVADVINELTGNFDKIPVDLMGIPGLNPSKQTTLVCLEYSDCNGFNCSGELYGRYVEFSFGLEFCSNPITANISVHERNYF